MSKGLFITGTDTDIGKTYVTALLVKTMRQNGYDTGYYKAAVSGAPTVAASDAGFVNEFAGIHVRSATMRRRCIICRISFLGCICRCLLSRTRGWGRSIMW